MIAFYFYFKPLANKKSTRKAFLICLIHSPGNYSGDLLMKDVCIWLVESFDSAAPYWAFLYIFTICSNTLLWEFLHNLCLQNRREEREHQTG